MRAVIDPCAPPSRQVLYLLGAMALSMALQLDRHGLWNLLGPSLFALGIMAVAWVRAVQTFTLQKHIYLQLFELKKTTQSEPSHSKMVAVGEVI